ncbi:MAG: TatD family hydrolase [Deltaproteobacteria bacterium]|nr:TatD family hydrolase [Deltaproteobacteria bacterium]
MIDTHAHLDFPDYDADREEVLKRAKEAGVEKMIIVSTEPASLTKTLHLAKQYDPLYATVGIHPHDTKEMNEELFQQLLDLGREEKVVAVGETGLDFYYEHSPRETQMHWFRRQIEAARSLKVPLIIHTRQANEETLSILRDMNADEIGGVFHCFTSDWEMARQALDLGFYISFTGIVTFKKADDLREVVKKVPLEKMLLETDSPFLTPEPLRGKRNEPAFMIHTAQLIASLKNRSMEEIDRVTTANAVTLFRLA